MKKEKDNSRIKLYHKKICVKINEVPVVIVEVLFKSNSLKCKKK